MDQIKKKEKERKKNATHNIENKHPIFQNWGGKIGKIYPKT